MLALPYWGWSVGGDEKTLVLNLDLIPTPVLAVSSLMRTDKKTRFQQDCLAIDGICFQPSSNSHQIPP